MVSCENFKIKTEWSRVRVFRDLGRQKIDARLLVTSLEAVQNDFSNDLRYLFHEKGNNSWNDESFLLDHRLNSIEKKERAQFKTSRIYGRFSQKTFSVYQLLLRIHILCLLFRLRLRFPSSRNLGKPTFLGKLIGAGLYTFLRSAFGSLLILPEHPKSLVCLSNWNVLAFVYCSPSKLLLFSTR